MLPFSRILEYGNIAPTLPIQKYKKIGCSLTGTLVLSSNGNLYSFGTASYSEIPSTSNKNLISSGVKDCWIGIWESLYLTENDRYIFNGNSQSIGIFPGRAVTNQDITSMFGQFGGISNIKKIGFNWRSMVVLLNDNRLFGIGYNASGQITGTGDQVSTWRLISSDVIDFKTTNNSTLFVLNSNGKILVTGSGTKAGANTNSAIRTLTPIILPPGIDDIYDNLNDNVFSTGRSGVVLYSPSTDKLFATGYLSGSFNNNSATSSNILIFQEISMLSNDGFQLKYRGKMFSVSGDPMMPVILCSRLDNSSLGFYFSGDNTNGLFGIGNSSFQTRLIKSGINVNVNVMDCSRIASYYSYEDNFFGAGSSIPGFSTNQMFYVRPNGFLPDDI